MARGAKAPPARGSVAIRISALGAVPCALGLISGLAYASAAGRIGRALRVSPAFARRQSYLAGGVYIGFGAVTAFVRSSSR